MGKFTLSVAATAILAANGCATPPVNSTSCGPAPTQSEISAAIDSYVKSVDWKDPQSVQVRDVRVQPCRAIENGLLAGGGYTVGYEIDFEINAKNSYGGYTGFELYSIVRKADGTLRF
jgi:hypothetical protein